MKRTLLVSAFAVMALAASAQISEVTKVKGDGFDFIPKGLTQYCVKLTFNRL